MKAMKLVKRKISLETIDKIKLSYNNKKLKGISWGRKAYKLDMKYILKLRSLGFGYRGIAEELYLKQGIRVSHITIKNRLDNKYL